MSQKNETVVLVLALLITAALVGGGFWWFTKGAGLNVGSSPQSSPNSNNSSSPSPANTSNSSPTSTGEGFSQVQNIPSGLFNYGGSTSWAPIRLSIDPAIQAARPEFRLRYVQPLGTSASSGSGIKMLLDGKIAFAQSSRSILDREYQQAQQRGFTLQQIPVAIDGLAVAVNPNLNIPGLTLQQLKSIYTGAINNWQQVGGPNLPIQPFSRPTGTGGTVDLFVEEILAGQPFGGNVRFIPSALPSLW
jgi:phosphate transport system substrate-binding protein